jgi:hypothetical protein
MNKPVNEVETEGEVVRLYRIVSEYRSDRFNNFDVEAKGTYEPLLLHE